MTNTLTQDLKVICWNVQSVIPKFYEIVDYFESNVYDVICLSETWLKNSHKLYFPSYKLYRVDRQVGEHGGVAIAVNKKIKHTLIPSLNTKAIESVAVSINTPTGPIVFVSVYFPGSDLTSQNMSRFKQDIKTLTSIKSSYFVCGDLNAKHRLWNNLRNNSAGKIIFDELNYVPFMVHNSPTPTYYPPQADRNPSNIDIVLTNHLHNPTQVVPNHDLMSDHCAIEFSVYCSVQKISCAAKHFRYDLANWNVFQSKVNEKVVLNNVDLTTTGKIDAEIDKFTTTILDSMNQSIPKRSHKVGYLKLNANIKSMISKNKVLRRRYNRYRNIEDLQASRILTKKIKTEILHLRNMNFNSALQTLDYASNKFWKFAKLIKNKSSNMPPLRNSFNQFVYTNVEKANEIASTILKSHMLTKNLNHRPTEKIVNRSATIINKTELSNETTAPFLTSPTEIKNLIRSLKLKKAPGDDSIPNLVLKKLPFRAIVFLTKLVNACLLLGYFPNNWKLAKVIAILKPNKNPTDPSSYRPISLLSSLSKILERILLKRINAHCEHNYIIPDHQFGFRNKHSTAHQLYRVVKSVKNNFKLKKSTGMILLDIEKAFDTIWHDGLLHKLLTFKVPIPIIKIIKSFLSNRFYYVQISGANSEKISIPAGLPQGSSLSPSLYNIYTSDLEAHRDCTFAQFADDTGLLTSGKSSRKITKTLEKSYKSVSKYYLKWKIKTNDEKIQAIFFSKRRAARFLARQEIKINGCSVPWSCYVKYLGVFLDNKLTFQEHTRQVQLKALRCIRLLYPLVNKKSKLSERNKILIFKSMFRPTLLYAAPVWGGCANCHLNKLQITQNKFLKLVFNKPMHYSTKKLHLKAQIDLIRDSILAQIEKFKNNCLFSVNPLITSLSC